MPIPITSQSNALSQAYPHLTTENYNILKDFLDKIETIDGLRLDSIHEWPIIPDDGSGISSSLCCRNILIICGDKSKFFEQRWKNVLSLGQANVYLLDYYERCKHITKLGVLLTDVWRPSTLTRWSHIYEMYETMGIQSVALLYSGHQITPIRWPWR